MTVTGAEGCFYRFGGLGARDVPCTEADGRHFITRVEGEGAAKLDVSSLVLAKITQLTRLGPYLMVLGLLSLIAVVSLLPRMQVFLYKIDRMLLYESWLY